MTKQKLRQYRSLKREIADTEHKIQCNVTHGVVKSAVNFPYQNRPVIVCGIESSKQDITCRLQYRLLDLKSWCNDIESFVDGIEDSETRRIFRLYYIDGYKKSWQKVAYLIGGNHSTADGTRMKHDRYLISKNNS